MRKFKTLALALPVALLALTLTSCDGGDDGAKDAAQKLAEALSSGNLSSLSFANSVSAETANTSFTELIKPLGEVKPKVSLGEIQVDKDNKDNKDKISATLSYEWSFGKESWKYNSTASLSKTDKTWSTLWTPELIVPGFQEGDVLQLQTTAAPRGKILGDGGQVLVQDRPVLLIGIDKTKVNTAGQPSSAKALATLVGVDPAAFASQVQAAGPQAFVQAISLRDDANRTVTDAQIAAIPGAVGLKDTLPLAPTRSFARPVLGTVGEATKELIEKSDGRLKAGDLTGLSGLQAQYDEQLSGTSGIEIVEKPAKADAAGTPRVLFTVNAKAGSDLKTTLSLKTQNLAESLLSDTTSPSAIVAIKPSTGAVLAAASGPASNGYNTALLGQYAPGSTFKTITSLALLRNGLTPDSTVPCTPSIAAGGTTFKNAPGYPESSTGQITLRDAFAHSCNTAFISQAGKVSQAQLAEAAASLGIGTGGAETEFGAENFSGNVPASGTDAEHAASMIGQGKVLVSPWTMANVAASVSHGSKVQAKLVQATPSTPSTASASSGTSSTGSASTTDSVPSSPPLTTAEAAKLKDMMSAVVTSGHAAVLQNLPGGAVIAKTGTAEYGNDNPPKTHSWMIAAQGDIAVVVFVEDGGLGAGTAGPIMADFLNGLIGK
nr:penicillin-binding transpeptidase domain-containing protein [Psychromicrobium silvestre]